MNDYSSMDKKEVTQFLFYPRKEAYSKSDSNATDFDIKVADNIQIGAKFHMSKADNPNLLFFHGNGEIVSDYDDIANYYTKYDMNFLAVDYRGYGRSLGEPSASSMMNDALIIFQETGNWLKSNNYIGPIFIMGRSLGSASALEIASNKGPDIAGLIIESGFAYTVPLLKLVGVNTTALNIKESDGFGNIEKIKKVTKPTLIIHAQYDQIIPVTDAETLQSYCAAHNKQLQIVPRADHNNILMITGITYFEVIKSFIDKVLGKRKNRFFRKS